MSEQSTLFIDNAPFLGRIEEQQRFRDALRQVLQENSIAAKAKKLVVDQDTPLPFVFLLYGEGGMGKSTLAKQLRHITTTEAEFKDHFEALWLDWEARKQLDLKLVARESVSPETVFEHIYAIFRDANFGKEFDTYEKALTTRAEAEKKVAQALDATASEGRDRYGILRELGANGLAWLARSGLVGGTPLPVPQEPMVKAFEAILGGGAEALARARETATTLLRSRLNPDEFDLFTLPNETLARKLADGIWKAAQKKPIVLTLDTYEIADRADVWLRVVIQRAGPNIIWVIAGRDNLAESRKYGQSYQPGYRADFASDRLRVFSMDEFSVSDVAEYFNYRVPKRPLDNIATQAIHQAALGIPLAVKEAAAIWQNPAKTLIDITGDGAPGRDRDKIVQTMTERFLLHCWDDPQDRARLYALALAYQPDADLLSAMLGTSDLEATLSELERRHSFVFVTDMKLHDKVSIWIREYLQAEVHRKSKHVRDLHQRAVQHLRERLTQQEMRLPLLEDRASEERWTTDTAALIYHSFWLDEVQGWTVLLPAFVGGLGYNHDFARALLDAAQSLTRTLSKTGHRRLKTLRAGLHGSPDATQQRAALNELESTYKSWPKDGGEAERRAILDLRHGQLLYHAENFTEAFERYKLAEQIMPTASFNLKSMLSNFLTDLGEAITESNMKEAVYQHAVKCDPNNARALNDLGVLYHEKGLANEAIVAYESAIKLDDGYSLPHRNLGWVYSSLQRHDEAIDYFYRAAELGYPYPKPYKRLSKPEMIIAACKWACISDPNELSIYLEMGNAYSQIMKYGEAKAVFKKAMGISPLNAQIHNDLANVYFSTSEYLEAIKSLEHSIQLDPEYVLPYENLGYIHLLLGNYQECIAAFKYAAELRPDTASYYNNLGIAYRRLKQYNHAINGFQKAIAIDSQDASPQNNLGNIYLQLSDPTKAAACYMRALQLKPSDAHTHLSLAICYEQLGNKDEAMREKEIARNLIAYDSEYNRAVFEFLCGNIDEALALLEVSLEKKLVNRVWARRDPDFESLRSDPRFIALVGKEDEEPSTDATPSG